VEDDTAELSDGDAGEVRRRTAAAGIVLPCSCGCADGARPPLLPPWPEAGLRRGSGYPCDVDGGSKAGASLPPPTSLRPFRVPSVGTREVFASVGPAPTLEEAVVSLRIRRRREGDRKMKGVIPSPLQRKKR
jgi:hypothetical protein